MAIADFLIWSIDLIELPAPKKGKVVKEGFEHFEAVCDLPFDGLIQKLPSKQIDLSGLRRPLNQELELQLEGGCVKFHHLSLESVICLESNQRVFSAIEKLGVLESLQSFEPLIAGTFPLSLETKDSDVDILLFSQDLDRWENSFRQFSSLEGFDIFQNAQTIGCQFIFEGVPFELFAQNKRSVSQDAYRHFQVEERLLKLGGVALRERLSQLRKEGFKTEPAFAKALQIKGDPYQTLLEWHRFSERELQQLLRGMG